MSSSQTARKFRRRDIAAMPHLLAKAIWELGRARLRLNGIGARDIARLNNSAKSKAAGNGQSASNADLIARIGFLVTFASRHLPWRSDCLPQAMAAQHWLSTKGIASEIRIGVERPGEGQFGAHAWLVQGEQIVTGGEVGHFAVLIGEERSRRPPDVSPTEE